LEAGWVDPIVGLDAVERNTLAPAVQLNRRGEEEKLI
jgi:hypothetical protein